MERQFQRKTTSDALYGFAGIRGEFVVGSNGMGVSVWDRETGRVLVQPLAYTVNAYGVAINPHNPLEFVSYNLKGAFTV
jgi:hypothetical protein